MTQLLITTLVVFISTSLDDLVLLLLFLSQAVGGKERKEIFFGQLMAVALLLGISIFGSYFANRMLEEWVIGLLGFIPILLAIKAIRKKEDAETKKIPTGRQQRLSLTVAGVLLASGSDNIGMYVPWFATLGPEDLFIVVGSFVLLVALLFFVAQQLMRFSTIGIVLNRFSQILVPLVFLILGGSILSEMGTISRIMHLFSH